MDHSRVKKKNREPCPLLLQDVSDAWKRKFIKVKFPVRMQMLRDIQCGNVLEKLVVGKRLGEGSFGTVYSCKLNVGGKIVALAVKETRAGVIGEQNIDEVGDEAELAYRMARLGVGPRVYDIFAIKFHYPRMKGMVVFQYILMRALAAGNLETFIHKQPPKKQIMAVVPQALRVLRKTLEAGVECYDVKPANFVYEIVKEEKKVKTVVCMIDFGFPHCETDRERKCVSEHSCRGLRGKRQRVLFVALATQLLFQLRRNSKHPEWVAEAAGRDRVWYSRDKIVPAVIEEFKRNKHLRNEYQWYRRVPMAQLDSSFLNDLDLVN